MDDELDDLIIEVRAETSAFQTDIEGMRSTIDTSLLDGFSRAGTVLERGLLSAIRSGKLGFDDLKSVAFRAMNEIAAQAVQSGIGSLFGGGAGQSGLSGLFTNTIGALIGLPGRATGGPVGPGSAYLVGERGPEVFVPTSAGRVETLTAGSAQGRDVRVAINLAAPRGSDQPAMLRRSTRQVASAVRRALSDA